MQTKRRKPPHYKGGTKIRPYHKKTNDEMVYLAAKSDVRKQQVEENSAWAPWVDAVENAEGRTTDVGLEYEDISAQLSEDLQAALNKG